MVYTVYKHTFPNNKVYIGITNRDVSIRWKNNGHGYKSQQLMWRAIQKYGWNNVRHDILNLVETPKEAADLEKYYITEIYHSNEVEFGYNIQSGGFYNPEVSEETKHKISQYTDVVGKKNPMYGKTHTPETREKLRQINLARHDIKSKRLKLWHRVRKESRVFVTIVMNKSKPKKHIYTEEERRKNSERNSGIGNPNYGKNWYNNGVSNLAIKLGDPIPEGFVKGMLQKSVSKKWSDETRAKIITAKQEHPRIYKPLSEETKKLLSEINKGKRRYNNGIVTILVKDGDPIPDGFVKGTLKKHGGEE